MSFISGLDNKLFINNKTYLSSVESLLIGAVTSTTFQPIISIQCICEPVHTSAIYLSSSARYT